MSGLGTYNITNFLKLSSFRTQYSVLLSRYDELSKASLPKGKGFWQINDKAKLILQLLEIRLISTLRSYNNVSNTGMYLYVFIRNAPFFPSKSCIFNFKFILFHIFLTIESFANVIGIYTSYIFTIDQIFPRQVNRGLSWLSSPPFVKTIEGSRRIKLVEMEVQCWLLILWSNNVDTNILHIRYILSSPITDIEVK